MSWHAWHLHYHGDSSRLLFGVIDPTVRRWWQEGSIDRSFFVRYQLGGPHIRWRVRLTPAADPEALGRHLEEIAGDFFAREPSESSWSPERIRQQNARILAADRHAGRDEVVADHTVVTRPYEPEIERFGGPSLAGPSHCLFTLQTALALEPRWAGETRDGRARLEKLAILLRMAVAGAADVADLEQIVRYPPPSAWKVFAPMIARAEKAFRSQPQSFLSLLVSVIDDHRCGGLHDATARLGAGVEFFGDLVRSERAESAAEVLGSHLHMCANRLGLKNAEELYLCRLAELAVGALRSERPELAGAVGEIGPPPAANARQALDDLAGQAFG